MKVFEYGPYRIKIEHNTKNMVHLYQMDDFVCTFIHKDMDKLTIGEIVELALIELDGE